MGFEENTLLKSSLSLLSTKKIVLGIFIDLSVSIGHVNHNMLIKTLGVYVFGKYGRRALQSVSHIFAMIFSRVVHSGEPPGCIHRPLSFYNDINDISYILYSRESKHYADGMSVF